MMKQLAYSGIGIDDGAFVRGKVPMTKQEVRVVSISKLKPQANDRCVDIGAGTGSLSIELGFLCKHVYAVECNPDAVGLIEENCQQFGLTNVEILAGMAPTVMETISTVEKVFIGGSKGKLKEIMAWCDNHLVTGGRIAANFITLENAVEFLELLRKGDYEEIDAVQILAAKGKPLGRLTMMQSNNPVLIISAEKGKSP